MDEKQNKEHEHFFGAAKVVAALTLLSRVLGMVRDMTITWLGANRTTDAFWFAFFIPNLFRRLFGEGALSAAFVPVFTETTEGGSIEKAGRLLANVLTLLGVFLLGVLVLVQVGLLVWITFWPGASADEIEVRRLLVTLLAIMMPFMVTVCLLGLASAALNCRGHFAYPAFAPIMLNISMIVAAVWLAPMMADLPAKLRTIAWSVPLAGVIQLIGVLWLLKRSGFPVRPRLLPIEGGVRQMLRLMGPALLGVGLLQISSLFDLFMAWALTRTDASPTLSLLGFTLACPLEPGVLVRYNAANRLYQLPMGVLAISLGVAVFPLLSRYAARNDMPNFRESLNRALRLALMEGLVTGTGLFILAEPIIKLIFQHGKFTPESASEAAFILRMYVLGMWAYCSYQMFARAFYSLKDMSTPLRVSSRLVVVYILLISFLVWIPGLGAGAFGVATATTQTINVLVMAYLLRKRLGRFGGRKLAASVMRSALACAAMAGALYLLQWQMAGMPNWQVVAVCVPAGAAVFVGAAYLMRAPELGELLGAMKRRKPDQAEIK
ncbi:MAG: murein biosynthesis integral membrane protein MurJ [Planctomycetaceae bacterium]|nr:MAG: murein biosynthesis integral membrane protein MurJ [Planctomycetaceae bacterium]